MNEDMPLIYEISKKGLSAFGLPKRDVPESKPLDPRLTRDTAPGLPEAGELDTVRHFTRLSRRNFSVDTHFYPLGSCTMKYNPKFAERVAAFDGFAALHPFLPALPGGGELTQGALKAVYTLEELLCEIAGMDAFTLQPMAGAQGEFAGVCLIAAYHRAKGNKKSKVILPDSSHGTNPASAAMAGYEVVTIPSLPNGEVDIAALEAAFDDSVAAVMLTCPNTLGIFETQIRRIAGIAHRHDALLYYDGANLNAILGKVRPGDIGFDVVHVNVHKTFATPHGGGGPGAGPVGVKKSLAAYLPEPRVVRDAAGKFSIAAANSQSIGQFAPFFGNFGVLLKALAYIVVMGREGLARVSEDAVLNANYILARLKPYYELPYDRPAMHECVFSANRQVKNGVRALDIAKYLIDREYHPPTIYFPLIVKEAMMIEPTETESKETLDGFVEAMIDAAKLAETDPGKLTGAPFTTPVSRPDEATAARALDIRWKGTVGA